MQINGNGRYLPGQVFSVIKLEPLVYLLLGLSVLLIPGVSAWARPHPKALYTHSVAEGVFRVFYTTEGKHAVPVDDVDGNAVPDRVDDILVQLKAADWFYQTQLGLVPPLKHSRYTQSDGIEVHVQHFDQGTGLAFDEPTKPNWFEGQSSTAPTLKIKIGSQVDPRLSTTPAHELFHVYQYAYSPFKTKWFTEGMARWLEEPFSRQAQFAVPPSPSSCRELTGMAYNANGFFARLAERQFKGFDQAAISDEYRQFVYSDGSPVIRIQSVYKFRPVKTWLERAAELGARESRRLGVVEGKWPETLQRSAQFDLTLCEALTKP
ncbi:hypothetical protein [Limnobacter sp.]|jgi:hypothetical protein|uniref:hypothetical protein n=1 Tax=Limnobacter sp. TaxID=2003368 RepID=UPI000DB70C7C|nr:hypothetical protein [Limnobacter sp.]MDP3272335.1 hypothetical protein [Limnobacter sp.]PZO17985.1 MAG: hypothetical protein DCE87_02640 [Betaproteobacteria bacterium]PZO25337.1 MAG: hypothetical protein DCE89_03575 [Betaproteobacteria bacterium]